MLCDENSEKKFKIFKKYCVKISLLLYSVTERFTLNT